MKTIADYAFYECRTLTSVTLGDCVAGIGRYAFYGCTSLSELSLGGGLRVVYSEAFRGCSSLAELTVPDTTERMARGAFYGCSSLASVTFGEALAEIEANAFTGCPLTRATFRVTSGWSGGDAGGLGIYGGTIPSSTLANPTSAAQYIRDFAGYEFTRG